MPFDGPHTFQVRRHDGGYSLGMGHRAASDRPVPVITRAMPNAPGSSLVPLPALAFEEFAGCVDAAGALAFANRYGLLGRPERSPFREVAVGGLSHQDDSAERVEGWLREAEVMRETVENWRDLCRRGAQRDMHQAADVGPGPLPQLAKYLAGVMHPDGAPSILVFDQAKQNREPGEKARLWREFGWSLLADFLTDRLRRHRVSPTIQPSRTRALGARGQTGVVLTFAPRAYTLLAALWLQFALATTLRYRFCEGCGKLMTIHPDTHRQDQKTCSPRCRKRGIRARQRASRDD